MMEEQYVSFKTAKLLKEKGFPQQQEYALAMYNEEGVFHSLSTSSHFYYDYNDFDEKDCIAVTQSLAMRWLREAHGLFIDIGIIPHSTETMEQRYYHYNIFKNRRGVSKYERKEFYATYEQACEAAIKYCLKRLL